MLWTSDLGRKDEQTDHFRAVIKISLNTTCIYTLNCSNYVNIHIRLPESDTEECLGSNDHIQPHGSCILFLYDSPDYSVGSFLDIHYTPLVYIHILQYVST